MATLETSLEADYDRHASDERTDRRTKQLIGAPATALPKNCRKLAFQTKPVNFDTFWPISQDSLHIFQSQVRDFPTTN